MNQYSCMPYQQNLIPEMKDNRQNYFVYAKLKEDTKRVLPSITIPKSKYHITLKYIGPLQQDQVKAIAQQLQTVTERHKDFTLKVDKYDTFNKGRIYHAATNRPDRLLELRKDISRVIGPDALGTTGRMYRPHITLDYGTGGNLPPKPKVPKFIIDKVVFSKVQGWKSPYGTIAQYPLEKRTRTEQFVDWLKNAG